jgi:hypothetical protein
MYLLRADGIARVSRAYRQPVSAGARPVHEAGTGAKLDIEVHPNMRTMPRSPPAIPWPTTTPTRGYPGVPRRCGQLCVDQHGNSQPLRQGGSPLDWRQQLAAGDRRPSRYKVDRGRYRPVA